MDTVSFTGIGRYNGQQGYRFEVTAVDRGEPGKGRDQITIVIRDGVGRIVVSVAGTIVDGNIQSAGRQRN